MKINFPIFFCYQQEIISNQWNVYFRRIFESSGINQEKLVDLGANPLSDYSSGGIWINKDGVKYLPLYEGRMIWHYTHRFNSMEFAVEGKKRKAIFLETKLNDYENPNFSTTPLYWIEEDKVIETLPIDYPFRWFLGLRKISGATNERTIVATFFPWCAMGDSIATILFNDVKFEKKKICCLLANLNSIILDFIIRNKITGNNLLFFIIEQLPVFPPNFYNKKLTDLISSKVIRLVYNAYDLEDLVKDLDFDFKPYIWDQEERFIHQAELDALYAHLYKINEKDLK